jgi:hypothetical protein
MPAQSHPEPAGGGSAYSRDSDIALAEAWCRQMGLAVDVNGKTIDSRTAILLAVKQGQ